MDPKAPRRKDIASAYAEAHLDAHAKAPSKPTWSIPRVYARIAKRLDDELRALAQAGLTLHAPRCGRFACWDAGRIEMSMSLPMGGLTHLQRKTFERGAKDPAGAWALLAWARFSLVGEQRFIEREVSLMLLDLARREARHCREEGIELPAALQAIKERMELEVQPTHAGRGVRRAAL